MGLVVGLVIVGVDAKAFTTKHVVGAEQVRRRRVVHHGANFGSGEVGDGVVGVGFK